MGTTTAADDAMTWSQNDNASDSALLLIDLVNGMSFAGGDALRERTERVADDVLALRDRADEAGVPVISVNDNHGHWRSERGRIIDECTTDDTPARDLVRRFAPRPPDDFVIKPHPSGFHATSLPVLLPKLGASRLVLAGVATDVCVLFTAADAHMRDYDPWVPSDVVASETDEGGRWALDMMAKSMQADTRSTRELSIAVWARAGSDASAKNKAERS